MIQIECINCGGELSVPAEDVKARGCIAMLRPGRTLQCRFCGAGYGEDDILPIRSATRGVIIGGTAVIHSDVVGSDLVKIIHSHDDEP